MSALENELSVPLFRRKPRGVALTEHGEKLLPKARHILGLIERARVEVQSEAIMPHGVVRLGMLPSINNALAKPLHDEMARTAPGLELRFVCGPSRYLSYLMSNGLLDMCLAQPEGWDALRLKVTPVLKECLYLVAHKELAAACFENDVLPDGFPFATLKEIPLLTTEEIDGLGALIRRHEEEHGVALDKRPTLGQLLSDLRAILNKQAGMILPWSAIHHVADHDDLVIAKVTNPHLERRIDLFSKSPFGETLVARSVEGALDRLLPILLENGLTRGSVLNSTRRGYDRRPSQ